MTALTPVSSGLTYPGIGKQSAFGTYAAPTYFPRVSKWSAEDSTVILTDGTFSGTNVKDNQAVVGPAHSEVSGTTPVAIDTIGFPLAGVLNLVTTTVGTPNVHYLAVTGANPAVYSWTDTSGVSTKKFIDCMFEEVTITGSWDKLAEGSFKCKGAPSATTSVPTPSWTGELPVQTWNSTVQIGANAGAAVDIFGQQWSITIKRTVNQEHTGGQRGPSATIGTSVEVTGSITGVASGTSTTELDAFIGGTPRYIKFTLTSPTNPAETLVIEVLNAQYETGKLDRPGVAESVKNVLTFRGVAAPTTFSGTVYSSPVQVTLSNAVAAGVLG